MLLVIDFFRFVVLKRTGVALKRTVLKQVSSAQLLVILAFTFRFELVVDCIIFWIFCFFSLFLPNCFIFCTVKSIRNTTGFEGFCNQRYWDLIPCSIDPSQHHLFAGCPLLSGRCVSERAINHPSFILRTDLCFKWFVDALIQRLQNWSQSTGDYCYIDVSSGKEIFYRIR